MIDEDTKALTIIVSYCYLVYVWVIASWRIHLPIFTIYLCASTGLRVFKL
jgi:hypothetical protein